MAVKNLNAESFSIVKSSVMCCQNFLVHAIYDDLEAFKNCYTKVLED